MLQLSGPGATRVAAGNDFEVCALADLKVLLKLPTGDSGQDTLLQLLLDTVHQLAFDYTGRMFRYSGTPYVQLYDGTNREYLDLWGFPVVALTSIEHGYLADSTGTFTTLRTLATGDYFLQKEVGRILGLRGWSFWAGEYCWKVTYTQGFQVAQMPVHLKKAMADWVGVMLKRIEKKTWDVLSETSLQEAKSYALSEMPGSTERVLRAYKRQGLMIGG